MGILNKIFKIKKNLSFDEWCDAVVKSGKEDWGHDRWNRDKMDHPLMRKRYEMEEPPDVTACDILFSIYNNKEL